MPLLTVNRRNEILTGTLSLFAVYNSIQGTISISSRTNLSHYIAIQKRYSSRWKYCWKQRMLTFNSFCCVKTKHIIRNAFYVNDKITSKDSITSKRTFDSLFFLYCKKFRNQYISINKEKVDFSLNISNKLTLLRASRVNAITQARQQSVVNFAVKIPRKETGVPKRKR